jgi:hypothetical protein
LSLSNGTIHFAKKRGGGKKKCMREEGDVWLRGVWK